MSSVVIIANPTAGGGRAGRAVERLRPRLSEWAPGCQLILTTGRGHAATLAEQAQREGAAVVVVAGGDGTFHEAVNGLLAVDAGPTPDLACLPLGTGRDLARSFDIADPLAVLDVPLARLERRLLDVGVAQLMGGPEGGGERPVKVYFVNHVNAGLGAWTAARVSGSAGLRRVGKAAYVLAAAPRVVGGARTDFAWVSESGRGRGPLLNVSICNGPSFGGGMRPCPNARHDDGWLHMALIDAIPVSRIPRLMYRAARGVDLVDPAICVVRGRSFRLEGKALVETDGEVSGRLPGRFSVLPGALTLRVPPPD